MKNKVGKIVAIAALDKNSGIGKDNDLIISDKDDLKIFKEITMGDMVVMGRKTYESLPNGPLKGRVNVVLSRNTELDIEGCTVCNSPRTIVDYTHEHDYVFIIGGESIYRDFIDVVDFMVLTRFDKEIPHDKRFPRIKPLLFDIGNSERFQVKEGMEIELIKSRFQPIDIVDQFKTDKSLEELIKSIGK